MKSWPESVPVLTAADICKGKFFSDKGKRCLLGHARHVFLSHGTPYLASRRERSRYWEVLRAIAKEAGFTSTSYIVEYNDSSRITKRKIADVWNRAMQSLGYTEIIEEK